MNATSLRRRVPSEGPHDADYSYRAAPTITRQADGSLVICLPAAQVVQSSHDDLVHRRNCGIEARAFDLLVSSGELPARKLGRRVYVRRSDLLALVDAAPAPTAEPTDELAAAVAKRARRIVR